MGRLNDWLSASPLLWIGIVAASVCTGAASAASPPNLLRDIPWDEDAGAGGYQTTYANTRAVEAAYNNARRHEERQLGLEPFALGRLELPSQSKWLRLSASHKALTIINAERSARGGVWYRGVQPLGLPLSSVESHLSSLAQRYADYMVQNNYWGHNGPRCGKEPFCETDPFTRIDRDPVVGQGAGSAGQDCHEPIERAENLAVFASTAPIPMVVERALYGFLYADASSQWGHRETALLQDTNLAGATFGFTNNSGDADSEGYFGVGLAGANDRSYRPLGYKFRFQTVLVFLMIDPTKDKECKYMPL